MQSDLSKVFEFSNLEAVAATPEQKQLEENVPVTDIHIHNGSNVLEVQPDYLNNMYPEKLNQFTVSKGVVFRYHFLSKSLYYWIEIVENGETEFGKLSKNDVEKIKEIYSNEDNFFFKLLPHFIGNKDDFLERAKEEEEFEPPGKSIRIIEKGGQRFELAYASADDKWLTDYRKRFEVLLIMFVDGASCVDEQESTWGYYMMYKLDSNNKRHFVGLLSKYTFRITFTKQRERISQALILPPYQRLGLAKQLLDAFYEDCIKSPSCFEITVEGPSFEFQCLRNFKDVELILQNGIFNTQELKLHPVTNQQDMKNLKDLYLTQSNVTKIKSSLKMSGQQIEHVVNILIFAKVLAAKNELLRAHYDDFLRHKLVVDLSTFQDRDIKPILFIDQKQLDLTNYTAFKKKEPLLVRTGAEVQEQLQYNLRSYEQVVQKLIKEKLIGSQNKEQRINTVQGNKQQTDKENSEINLNKEDTRQSSKTKNGNEEESITPEIKNDPTLDSK